MLTSLRTVATVCIANQSANSTVFSITDNSFTGHRGRGCGRTQRWYGDQFVLQEYAATVRRYRFHGYKYGYFRNRFPLVGGKYSVKKVRYVQISWCFLIYDTKLTALIHPEVTEQQ